jgi:hypothetical protein
MARLRKQPFDWPFTLSTAPDNTDYRLLMSAETKAMNALHDLADSRPAGEIVGRLAVYPAADDGAYYICVKDRPLTVAWIPYCDAYHAPAAWIRGLRKEDFFP